MGVIDYSIRVEILAEPGRGDTKYHAPMEEEDVIPWWRKAMIGMGFVLGLVVLSGVLMAGIIFVARFLDTARSPVTDTPPPIFVTTTPPPSLPDSARTRTPSPYAPEPWPSDLKRGAGYGGGDSRWSRSGGRAATESTAAPASAAKQSVPTGLSIEEYQAAVAAGKSVYLPNPKGQCDLDSGGSLRALESCLAAQAAR